MALIERAERFHPSKFDIQNSAVLRSLDHVFSVIRFYLNPEPFVLLFEGKYRQMDYWCQAGESGYHLYVLTFPIGVS